LHYKCINSSDGYGSKIFDPGWFGSNFCCSGWVGSGQPSLIWVWIWKISPKNIKFFNFLPIGSKKCHWVRLKSTRVRAGSASYLLQVKSMFGSGQGQSLISSFCSLYTNKDVTAFLSLHVVFYSYLIVLESYESKILRYFFKSAQQSLLTGIVIFYR